ncbi:hypothetical protein SIM91_43370 [Rhodococcus opacus]|uniref:hypothetical protein n=1 Tax=Rhodococcus opacus TaxID=37919 RepID=UPI0012DAED26|nr:hypothetical protein [Rhodococcus opacus]MDX5970004.1 hypothetical protein [Rhodococcus opacus]
MIVVIAEGLNTIEHANAGKGEQEVDRNDAAARPWAYENGIAVAEVAEVGRRGSGVASGWSTCCRRLCPLAPRVSAWALERPRRGRKRRLGNGHHHLALRAIPVQA